MDPEEVTETDPDETSFFSDGCGASIPMICNRPDEHVMCSTFLAREKNTNRTNTLE
jgi:hypothetical protein